MSTVDDILFAPIDPDPIPGVIDQALIAHVAMCMGDPNTGLIYSVSDQADIVTYRKIANVIEQDKRVFRHARQFCASDPFGHFRPKTALDITALFEMLHRNPAALNVFWSCPQALTGVISIGINNHFEIFKGMPTAQLGDGMKYEWWVLGLMSNFAGSNGYYCFVNEQDAINHWKRTP